MPLLESGPSRPPFPIDILTLLAATDAGNRNRDRFRYFGRELRTVGGSSAADFPHERAAR
jgi:hypothetical protein